MDSSEVTDSNCQIRPFTSTLVWAVMTKTATGKSEIVRVVSSYEEADLAVQDNPSMFYKSGPVLLA
jgi:hypothetical protein